MDPSWISLLPFLIVIPISIITKQVQPGLFVALLLGSYLIDPSLLGGIQKFLTYIVHTTVVANNIRIIIFLYAFAGLIEIIKMAGGIKGFVELVSKKVKTKKSAMLLTWISTMGTFSDPDFRIVTIAPIMKALKDRLKMSSRRIGIVIEVTSNPVVALVPVATGFVGYMVATINTSMKHAGIHRPPYLTYIESIPFNFFSFAILGVGIYYTFFMHQKHEKKFHFTENEKAEAENTARKSGEGANQDSGTQTPPVATPSPVMANTIGSGNLQPTFTNANIVSPVQSNVVQPMNIMPIQQPINATQINPISNGGTVQNPILNMGQLPNSGPIQQSTNVNMSAPINPPSQTIYQPNAVPPIGNGTQATTVGVQNTMQTPPTLPNGGLLTNAQNTMANNIQQTLSSGAQNVAQNTAPATSAQNAANNLQPSFVNVQNTNQNPSSLANMGGQIVSNNLPQTPMAGTQNPNQTNVNGQQIASQNVVTNNIQPPPVGVPNTIIATPNATAQPASIQPISQMNGQYNEEYARNLDAGVISGKHVEKMTNANEKQGEEDLQKEHKGYDEETPSKPWNLILPLAAVLLLTLFLSWWDGHYKANTFFGAFIKVDALGVMLQAVLIALILTIAFFMVQKFPVGKIVTHFIKGGNQLMSVVVLLSLIWGVSAVSEDLGFSKYITMHVEGWIPSSLVAPILFLLGALISYFIGSSWGTWGLLMPLGVMLAHHAHANLFLVIGAVFASGTFGAFASPLSDNTVTLCTILDLPVMSYAKSKLVPALIAAGIATILFAGFSFIL